MKEALERIMEELRANTEDAGKRTPPSTEENPESGNWEHYVETD